MLSIFLYLECIMIRIGSSFSTKNNSLQNVMISIDLEWDLLSFNSSYIYILQQFIFVAFLQNQMAIYGNTKGHFRSRSIMSWLLDSSTISYLHLLKLTLNFPMSILEVKSKYNIYQRGVHSLFQNTKACAFVLN